MVETLVDEVSGTHLVMLDPNCRPAIVGDFQAFKDRVLRLIQRADLIKVSSDDVAYLFRDREFDEVVEQVVARGGSCCTPREPDHRRLRPDGRDSVQPRQAVSWTLSGRATSSSNGSLEALTERAGRRVRVWDSRSDARRAYRRCRRPPGLSARRRRASDIDRVWLARCCPPERGLPAFGPTV